ncbi:TSUP family transporter [Pseudoflavitalea sp. G-6-1-2]|uniref:TSUP family transporter n=1 Tax=Pseudoflavitalea sp. G-6-1-2 TaxID=2728841 RepID=UPI00146B941D|nr:TSUP family transporter [Pseudoflavitalea sp. G-6-1-2]NML19398.1 TSUP family transporter [Pseudoflavitalea sp. G-6-1-2]
MSEATSIQDPLQKTEEIADSNHLFPVFLKLSGLRVLLIGAGNVGLEKLSAMLDNAPDANITVVAPSIGESVRNLAEKFPRIALHERNFEEADLDNKDLVIVAINNKEVGRRIYTVSRDRNVLINVADTPDLCDFYLSSIVQKGQLKIAISTNGKSPTAAKRIKEVLNHAMPAELNDVLNNLHTVRNRLNGNFAEKVKRLNELTRVLVEEGSEKDRKWRKIATRSVQVFALMLIGHFIFSYVPWQDIGSGAVDLAKSLEPNFPIMLLAGFLAQMVDGALGMGYGVTSATILLSAGVNPAAISGSIHTAEMFASGASGYSHYKFGNVNKKLFKALLIPGVIGAILGAVLLTQLGESHVDYIRPIMAAYTLFLGIRILVNAFRKQKAQKKFKRYGVLAGAGGFLDSFGGGGWGPIVTTTLITKGRSPRYVIGSVSLAEFFVTLASAFTFFTLLGVSHWQTILALVVGGLIAAPLAAKLTGKLPRKTSFILLGCLVILWSIRILWKIL